MRSESYSISASSCDTQEGFCKHQINLLSLNPVRQRQMSSASLLRLRFAAYDPTWIYGKPTALGPHQLQGINLARAFHPGVFICTPIFSSHLLAPSHLLISIFHLAPCWSHLNRPVGSGRIFDLELLASSIFFIESISSASSGHISILEQASRSSHLPRCHLEYKRRKCGSPSSSVGASPQYQHVSSAQGLRSDW